MPLRTTFDPAHTDSIPQLSTNVGVAFRMVVVADGEWIAVRLGRSVQERLQWNRRLAATESRTMTSR